MQKKSFSYRILIIGSNSQEVKYISELIDESFFSSKITLANFENVYDILSSNKFNVILVSINNVNDIEKLHSVEKSTSGTTLIVISDNIIISDPDDLKTTDGNNNVFDYLPKGKLNSLLLSKSILYITEKNKC